MTDISESGIEAAVKAHNTRQDPTLYGMTVQDYGLQQHAREVVQMTAAIQAYLPFHPPAETHEEYVKRVVTGHPPASREAGLIDALTKVRDAILSPINSLAIVDTVWMPVPGATYSIETLVDFIDAQIALIPTKPEAGESACGSCSGSGYQWQDEPGYEGMGHMYRHQVPCATCKGTGRKALREQS